MIKNTNLDFLDPHIKSHVILLNKKGFITNFSCASIGKSKGNDYLSHSLFPYISFSKYDNEYSQLKLLLNKCKKYKCFIIEEPNKETSNYYIQGASILYKDKLKWLKILKKIIKSL